MAGESVHQVVLTLVGEATNQFLGIHQYLEMRSLKTRDVGETAANIWEAGMKVYLQAIMEVESDTCH